jgi:hypothetical protein
MLEHPLHHDERRVVAGETVEPRDEQHLDLATFGPVDELAQHRPALPAE